MHGFPSDYEKLNDSCKHCLYLALNTAFANDRHLSERSRSGQGSGHDLLYNLATSPTTMRRHARGDASGEQASEPGVDETVSTVQIVLVTEQVKAGGPLGNDSRDEAQTCRAMEMSPPCRESAREARRPRT